MKDTIGDIDSKLAKSFASVTNQQPSDSGSGQGDRGSILDTYISKNGQNVGPLKALVVLQGIASGQYLLGDLAWQDGMSQWVPLRQIFPQTSSGSEPPPLPIQPKIGDDFGVRLLLPVGRSGWAIAAGYLGLFSLILLPAPIAIVVSVMALRDIKKHQFDQHPKYGKGRAIFGMVMGVIGTVMLVLLLISGFFR